jgi:hypothetical protein
MRGDKKMRTWKPAAMAETYPFRPRRDSDTTSFIDDDPNRFSIVLLFLSRCMDDFLILLEDERNFPM